MNALPNLYAFLLASTLPERAFSGRIEGGWGYIWFCYALAWACVLGYALYLLFLRRQLKASSPEASSPGALPPGGRPSSSPLAS